MSSLFLFIVALQVLSLSQGFLFGGDDCDDQKDCVSCTSHESWFGDNCRWCPGDQACHAFGSIQNHCSSSENIVNKADCGSIVYTDYDRNLAYKMNYLSALAYADNVANYIAKATEVNTFCLVKQVTKSCPGNAECSGYTAVSHTEKVIVIAFRGSEHSEQVINEVLKILTELKVSFQAGGKVQAYFNDAFRQQNELVSISFRITHYRDPVVHLPTCDKAVPGGPCISLLGEPYHHGKEIYYGEEIMTKSSSYMKCEGLPHNEDLSCSNNVLEWLQCFSPTEISKCVADHKMYYGISVISVGRWWENI